MRRRTPKHTRREPGEEPIEPETSNDENPNEPEGAEARSPKSPYFLRSTKTPSVGSPDSGRSGQETPVRSVPEISRAGTPPVESLSIAESSGEETPLLSVSGSGTPRLVPGGSRAGTPMESGSSAAPVPSTSHPLSRGFQVPPYSEMLDSDAEISVSPEENEEIEGGGMPLQEALREFGEGIPVAISPEPGAGRKYKQVIFALLGIACTASVAVGLFATEHHKSAFGVVGSAVAVGVCVCMSKCRAQRRVGVVLNSPAREH